MEKKALLKTYTTKEKNLFPFFFKYTNKIGIGKRNFDIAIPELAILEILYNSSPLQKAYGEELIKRRLKKNKNHINYSFLEEVLKNNKHNSSMNRLALLLAPIDPEGSTKIKNLIKRYGFLLY